LLYRNVVTKKGPTAGPIPTIPTIPTLKG
jgi:hypothetical protein